MDIKTGNTTFSYPKYFGASNFYRQLTGIEIINITLALLLVILGVILFIIFLIKVIEESNNIPEENHS